VERRQGQLPKGRFAWGYANHQDRITQPMIRASMEDPWRLVSWKQAFAYTAARLNAIKTEHGARARRDYLEPLHQ